MTRNGPERARYEWRLFRQAVVASVISGGLLICAILLVWDRSRTVALEERLPRLGAVLALWLVFGPVIETDWSQLIRRRS